MNGRKQAQAAENAAIFLTFRAGASKLSTEDRAKSDFN